MRFTPEEFEVIDMATEDINGIWEAEWGIRRILPNQNDRQIRYAARRALSSLYSNGLIYFCWYDPETDNEIAIEPDQLESILNTQENWAAPEQPRLHVAFAATDKGRLEYARRSE